MYTRATVQGVSTPTSAAPDSGGSGPSERVGVRELRNNVAAVVRRAAGGDRIVITVDGLPAAQLGPLTPQDGAQLTLDDLIATGLAAPPGRADAPAPPTPEDVPVDVRPDKVLDELRGGR